MLDSWACFGEWEEDVKVTYTCLVGFVVRKIQMQENGVIIASKTKEEFLYK